MTKKWGMRTKLLLLCGFVSCVSMLVGFKSYIAMGDVVSDYNHVVTSIYPQISHLDDMMMSFRDSRIALRSLGLGNLNSEDFRKYINEAEAGFKRYEAADANFIKHPMEPGEKEHYDKVGLQWGNFQKLSTEVFKLARDPSLEARTRLFEIYRVDCPKNAEAFEAAILSLDSFVNQMVEKKSADATTEAHAANYQSAVLNIASFVITMLLGILFANGLAGSVRRVADTLSVGASEVTGAVSQLSFASSELSNSANQQSSALQETAASVEEISAMVNKNAESAADSSKLSEESRNQAERGKKTVEQMIQSMEDIHASNKNIQEEIQSNNQKISEIVVVIQEIGNKTKVINDIVFQTKLLSFNASVEAARAGEHGRGFSVVAEEVGNLAQMSGNAAKEISGLLDQSVAKVELIVTDTKAKVETLMSQARSTVDRGSDVARECGEILEQIVTNAGKLSDMVSNISLASQEQSHGVSEISKAIQELDRSTQINATATQQTATSASLLTTEVESLKAASMHLREVVEGSGSKEPVMKFVWKDQYSLGIAAMDDEHKVLIDKINSLASGLEKGVKHQKMRVMFKDLADYCVEHFGDEEKFLESINYPDIKNHKAIHAKLLAKVGAYGADLDAGRLDAQSLVAFLNDWLIQHILGVDMKYSRFHAAGNRGSHKHPASKGTQAERKVIKISASKKGQAVATSGGSTAKIASGGENFPRHDDPGFENL